MRGHWGGAFPRGSAYLDTRVGAAARCAQQVSSSEISIKDASGWGPKACPVRVQPLPLQRAACVPFLAHPILNGRWPIVDHGAERAHGGFRVFYIVHTRWMLMSYHCTGPLSLSLRITVQSVKYHGQGCQRDKAYQLPSLFVTRRAPLHAFTTQTTHLLVAARPSRLSVASSSPFCSYTPRPQSLSTHSPWLTSNPFECVALFDLGEPLQTNMRVSVFSPFPTSRSAMMAWRPSRFWRRRMDS